jgi:hypothetical protein
MSSSKLACIAALVAFVALTGIAVSEHGYLGFFEIASSNSATRLMLADLVIGLSLILVWMFRDEQARSGNGMKIAPYAIVTLLFGVAGPLLYLIRRRDGANA